MGSQTDIIKDDAVPTTPEPTAYKVVDLFSGGGGMSFGFHAHPAFEVIGAADAQLGKPSSPKGSLACNTTYESNMGIAPVETDLGTVDPESLRRSMGITSPIDVLSACPPCTGFSRTNAKNHLADDKRNSLVGRTIVFVDAFQPKILVMENARELLQGRWAHHFEVLKGDLEARGYTVHAQNHVLNKFGLPQVRERALVIAVAAGYDLRTLEDAWAGRSLVPEATTVRRALDGIPVINAGEAHPSDDAHASPSFHSAATLGRLQKIPHDGGSWRDLLNVQGGNDFLTPAMVKSVAKGDFGSFPDVYGRMAWDRPAPTIKRECAHVGNGRYSHPTEDRLCSVRELGILNGFPRDYKFDGTSLSNKYRHIGDAVPPLVSYQLASVCRWILTGERPSVSDLILPGTHLRPDDIREIDTAVTGQSIGRQAPEFVAA
ncbi:cytosine-specific methyltransferase [Streptomyces longisporoflavus]|uniref:DNA cytosine methyltransferase n=1 Tax=Streptomyces longisporoflavus TaxID=28044 RepID=UPI00198E5737|nr:DNA cytosine methyltransferase [Streptomyces longisporoflavus]GGV43351.1 cytosine-specific methyltransferase [Streptomyces longisporoflavus]